MSAANLPRVLLVYANPAVTASPVVPYGMERIAHALRLSGCRVELLAPWIEADPRAALDQALAAGPWDLVGFSLRNLDDALVVRSAAPPVAAGPHGPDIDTGYYLDAVRPLVQAALAALGPARVLVGGAALSSGPEVVLAALGASWGIAGPAEDLAWRLGRALATGQGPVLDPDPRIVQLGPVGPLAAAPPARGPAHDPVPRDRGFAAAWRPAPGPTPRMGPYLGLALARGGRVPVQVAAGCDRRCHFCVEARFTGHLVRPRPVPEIVAEIDSLVAVGVRRFWLATSELNVPDERHAIALLRALAGRGLDLQAFVQVAPVSDALLDAMEAAGLDPSGLSFELGHLDDALLRAGAGPANLAAIERLVSTFLRRGYRTLGGSVLLGAHPQETAASLDRALSQALAFDAALPDGLGLAYACGGRVYPRTALADWVTAHPDQARPHLYGDPDPTFVRPVVFCRPVAPRALMAQVAAALSGARGRMGPMNTEAAAGEEALLVEALVNRGIWRRQEGRSEEAAALLSAALDLDPLHLEGLAQLAMVQLHDLSSPEASAHTLRRLLAALGPTDPRRAEILAALRALGA